jgi:hypothetical protein
MYKVRVHNKVVDALSRKPTIVTLRGQIIGFDYLKQMYKNDKDFDEL